MQPVDQVDIHCRALVFAVIPERVVDLRECLRIVGAVAKVHDIEEFPGVHTVERQAAVLWGRVDYL